MRIVIVLFVLLVILAVGSFPARSLIGKIVSRNDVPIHEYATSGQHPSCSRGVITGNGPDGDGIFPVHAGPSEAHRLVQRLKTGRQVLVFDYSGDWAGIVWDRRDRLCGTTQTRYITDPHQGWVRTAWLTHAPF